METAPTLVGNALVPTENASRYLQQLCKHWQHNLQVEFTPEHGTVRFPATPGAQIIPQTPW